MIGFGLERGRALEKGAKVTSKKGGKILVFNLLKGGAKTCLGRLV